MKNMRWIDKPRKKTSREIVIEYMKFLKIMGQYHTLAKTMYNLAKLHGNYVPLYENHIVRTYPIENILYKENMIKYLQACIVNNTTFNKSTCERLLGYQFLSYLGYKDCVDMMELLWSYFKEKHIANCIIVGDK